MTARLGRSRRVRAAVDCRQPANAWILSASGGRLNRASDRGKHAQPPRWQTEVWTRSSCSNFRNATNANLDSPTKRKDHGFRQGGATPFIRVEPAQALATLLSGTTAISTLLNCSTPSSISASCISLRSR